MPTFFITGIPYCIFGYYSSDQALKFAMSNPKLSSEMERKELSKMLQSLRLRYILQLITLMFLFIGVTTCICHPDGCDALFAVLAMTAALQAAFLFTAQNESRRILKVLRGGRNSGTFNKRLRFREFGSRSSVRYTDISFAEYILFALVGLLTFAVNIIVFSGGIVLESILNHP